MPLNISGGQSPPTNEAARLTRGGVAKPNTSISSSEPAYSRHRADPQPVELSDLRFRRQLERLERDICGEQKPTNARFVRDVERLHSRGPQWVAAALIEIASTFGIRGSVEEIVFRHAGGGSR